ncbi:hypothetical protein Gpo141_00004901 [Globisporangium polare]
MSFFTSNAYASFHQHLPPNMQITAALSSSSVKKLSPQKKIADRRLDNASFGSTTSTISEFDPLSPLNLTRAADPWFGNSHLTATPTTSSQQVAASLKVYDQEDEDDEEWGEFMNFSKQEQQLQELDLNDDDDQEDQRASNKSRRASNKAAKFECEYTGWQRIPRATSDGSDDDDNEPSSQHHHKDMYQARLYQQQPQHHSHNQRSSQSLTMYRNQQKRPSGTLETFASAVLSRLSSFRSSSSPGAGSASMTQSSWSTRLFSGEGDEAAPHQARAQSRGYDSYDVTFEKGPIGLELETDWYGRQAVVKGFRKVLNDQDGPAIQCGIIRVGDVLTAIDGTSCLEMSFQETLAKLRDVSGRRHVLHFKSLEAAGDLSVYNSDMDIIQAKRFIHQHKEKFYRPPPPKPVSDSPTGSGSSTSASRGDKQLIFGCVERLRGETVTAFNFHREDTGEFIMACSCVNECTGVFVFHTLQDSHLREFKDLPQSEDSAVYLGQMVPNFLGTEFTVLDHQQKRRNELGLLVYSSNVLGRVPNFLKCVFPKQQPVPDEEGDGDETSGTESQQPQQRSRAATTGSGMGSDRASFNLHTSSTMMDRNGSIVERYKNLKQQRQLSLVERLRHFSLDDLETSFEYASGSIDALWHDADDHDGRGRAMRLRSSRTASARNLATPYGAVEQTDFQCDLLTFETKKPAWNDELGAWTLNFHGRVKLASKKNFLMVPEQGNEQMEAEFPDETQVFLRFGKVTKSRFSLDFQAPLSPMLALAIICSAFAHKIAVT